MSLIVAGRFTTFPDAEAAANRLFAAGFVQEDVTLFFVNPRGQHARFPIGGDRYADPQAARASKGAGKGGAIGAVIGAVIGVALFSAFSSPFLILVVAAGITAGVFMVLHELLCCFVWCSLSAWWIGRRTGELKENRQS